MALHGFKRYKCDNCNKIYVARPRAVINNCKDCGANVAVISEITKEQLNEWNNEMKRFGDGYIM